MNLVYVFVHISMYLCILVCAPTYYVYIMLYKFDMCILHMYVFVFKFTCLIQGVSHALAR